MACNLRNQFHSHFADTARAIPRPAQQAEKTAHLMSKAKARRMESAPGSSAASSRGTTSSYTVSSCPVYAFWHGPNSQPTASSLVTTS